MCAAANDCGAGLGNLTIDYDQDQLGRGFKSIEYDFTSSSPLTDDSIGEAVRTSPKQSGWAFTIDVTRSNRELIDKLDVKASAAARLWGVDVSGRASWFSDRTFTEETLVVFVSAQWVIETRALDVRKLRLKADAADLMMRQPRDFYGRYGSHFIGSVDLGGQLTLFFKRNFSTLAQKQSAYAEINGKYGQGSASASALNELAKSLDTYGMHAEGFGVGGEPVLDYQADWKAEQWIQWALGKWMKSVEAQPKVMSADLWTTWTVEGADLNFPKAIGLAAATGNYEALTQWRMRLEEIHATAVYLVDDPDSFEPTPAQIDQLKTWRDDSAEDIHALDEYYHQTEGLDVASPERLLAERRIRLEPDTVATELDALHKALQKRRPLAMGDRIHLRTTGENDYWIAGPKDNMGPSMSQDRRVAVVLQMGFDTPRVGGQVRLHSSVGLGDRLMIAAVGRNTWLQYKKRDNKSDEQKWTIEAKRDGGDARIRDGDRIRLTSVKYPDMTIKAREKGGIYWAMAKSQTSHWLLVERAD